jgi:hypothetical protein
MVTPIPKPPRRPNKRKRLLLRAKNRREHYGGAADYPALRLEVFARDRYRCLFCGADHLKTACGLEIAHLRAVGMGGRRVGSPGAMDHPMWLATACHRCGRLVDQASDGLTRTRKRNVVLGLHEKYGYPYPEGVLNDWRDSPDPDR